MSLAASSLIYGKPIAHMGPRVKSVQVLDDDLMGQRVHINFLEESVGAKGLYLQAAQVCPEWSQSKYMGCGKVQLITESESVEAIVTLSSSSYMSPSMAILLTPIKALEKPIIQVSYCQGDYPLMTVYNDVGAPLLPFVYNV